MCNNSIATRVSNNQRNLNHKYFIHRDYIGMSIDELRVVYANSDITEDPVFN